MAPAKIEILTEILSSYQLKTANFYNVLVCNVKKLMPNFFDKNASSCASLWKLATLFKVRIGAKKMYCVLEFNQSQ